MQGTNGARGDQDSPSSVPPAVCSSLSWYFILDLSSSNSVPSWMKDSKESSPQKEQPRLRAAELPLPTPEAAASGQGWVLGVWQSPFLLQRTVPTGMVFIQAAPWSLLPAACPSPWQPHLPFAGSVAKQYK